MTAYGEEATTQVECSGTMHTVAVQDGRLVTLDHPTPDRERTLMGLGGDPIACIGLLDAWDRHCDDLEVLVLASRGPGDDVQPSVVARRSGRRAGLVGSSGSAPAPGVRGWTGFAAVGQLPAGRPMAALFGRSSALDDATSGSGAAQLLSLDG